MFGVEVVTGGGVVPAGGPVTGVARELLGPECGGVLDLVVDDMISSLMS